MTEQRFKTAFAVSITLCIALAVTLGYVLVRRVPPTRDVQANADPVVARGSGGSSSVGAGA